MMSHLLYLYTSRDFADKRAQSAGAQKHPTLSAISITPGYLSCILWRSYRSLGGRYSGVELSIPECYGVLGFMAHLCSEQTISNSLNIPEHGLALQ